MHGGEVVSVGWTVIASHKWCLVVDACAAQAVRASFSSTHDRDMRPSSACNKRYLPPLTFSHSVNCAVEDYHGANKMWDFRQA